MIDPKPEDSFHLLPTWEIGNKKIRHAILSILSNELFNIYCQFKVAKEIWGAMLVSSEVPLSLWGGSYPIRMSYSKYNTFQEIPRF